MEPQPDTVDTGAANASMLARIKEEVHPMAKAIPSLHREIKKSFRTRNIGKHRNWSESAYSRVVPKWRNFTLGEKPELAEFLSAWAAHKVLQRPATRWNSAFATLVEHRRWSEWSEEEMKARAAREGINLVEALQETAPELALQIKLEAGETEKTDEASPAQTIPPPQQPAQQQLTETSRQLASEAAKQQNPEEPPQTESERAQEPVPAQPQQGPARTLLQQALISSHKNSVTESVPQSTDSAAVHDAEAPTAPPKKRGPDLAEGSLLPMRRTIECPAQAHCTNLHKRARTKTPERPRPEYADSSTQTEKPQWTAMTLPPQQRRTETQSTTPASQQSSNRDDDRGERIIGAVDRLVKSNENLGRSFQSSLRSLDERNLQWQQRAQAMLPAPTPYYRLIDPRMIEQQFQPMQGGNGQTRHPMMTRQIPQGPTVMMGDYPTSQQQYRERMQYAAADQRPRNGMSQRGTPVREPKKDEGKEQSRFF